MKLKSLNKLDPKYGFQDVLWFDDDSYHGHQRAIALCIKDDATGEIYRNYMHPLDGNADANELVEEILNDKNIRLLVDQEAYISHDELKTRTLYQLPYANIDSPAFKTTINYDGADDNENNLHRMTVEILLVTPKGLNRYIEIVVEETNKGPVQAAIDFLKDEQNLADIGFEWVTASGDHPEGWYIDVYNEASMEGLAFMGATPDDILLHINSIRLIGIETLSSGAEEQTDETKPEEVTVYAE